MDTYIILLAVPIKEEHALQVDLIAELAEVMRKNGYSDVVSILAKEKCDDE